MSIQAPQGILNIPNATLRVGRLEISEVVGADTALNTIARNTILLVDDDTYHVNKNWGLKLPNAWAGEFECNTASAGNYSEFNFYNEGSSSNAQGYNLTFNDTAVQLRYDGSLLTSGSIASTVTGTGVKKVRLMFERNILSVTVDGTLVFTYTDTSGPRPRVYSTTAGGFLNFFTDGGALKNLKIVNEKWISDGTSNIAYVGGGEVAVGKALAFNRVSNVSQVKVDSNVVTEYTGPHDRPLRKYPEVALTSASDSGYVTSSSTTVGTYYTWKAFDNNLADDSSVWTTVDSIYDSNDNYAYNSDKSLGGVDGEWLKIELPNKIKPSYVRIYPRTYVPPIGNNQSPEDFKILASNDDTNWVELVSVVGWVTNATWGKWDISSNTSYKYFAIVCTRTIGAATFGLAEIEYYGYEEGSGSLDTTLKTVYNVPATTGTQLEVYYDGQDYSGTPTSITDRSPNTITATANNITIDTTYKSFEITSSPRSNIIADNVTFVSGDEAHTYALWVRLKNSQIRNLLIDYRPDGGTSTTGNAAGILIDDYNQRIQFYHQAADVETRYTFTTNVWYHIICSYSGGGNNTVNSKIYINGVEQTNKYVPSGNSTSTLTLPTTGKLTIGDYLYAANYGMGDGNIGNVRLYSKALNADQVKELYDYQKDYFLGSKSQVTLYKGHLGVGVTEPSGQLELAGDERIQEYPPRGMTGYETLMEGHGTFRVLESSSFTVSASEDYLGWEAFDKNLNTIVYMIGDSYDGTSGIYTGSNRLAPETAPGAYLVLEMPYKIYPKHVLQYARDNNANKVNKAIYYGKADPGDPWTVIHNQNTPAPSASEPYRGIINSDVAYQYLAIVVTNGATVVAISNLAFFGTPGPTTLDKGSLTLGRSLDVPRVSRYDVDTETPRPEKLVLDFDTTVNDSPTDISGRGNHGRMYANAQYSPVDKAFKFDGTDDVLHVNGAAGTPTGDAIYTLSCWVKTGATQVTTNPSVFYFGSAWTGSQLAGIYFREGNKVAHDIGSTNVYTTNPTIIAGQWHHIVVVKRGTGNIGANTTYQGIFVDGVEITQLSIDGAQRQQTIVAGSQQISIGTAFTGTIGANGAYGVVGFVSKPQIWNVALEPSEVKKLYNLGRTGRSMVISDTAVGIGKTPEAQMDVRGLIKAAAMHIPNTVVQVRAAVLTGDTSTKDVNSGHRNSFVKLNITPRFKNSIILFDFKFLIYMHDSTGTANGASCIVRRHSGDPAALTLTGTNVYASGGHNLHYYTTSNPSGKHIYIALMGIDTPNTLEEIYYVLAFRPYVHDGHTLSIGNGSNQPTSVRLMEIAQ